MYWNLYTSIYLGIIKKKEDMFTKTSKFMSASIWIWFVSVCTNLKNKKKILICGQLIYWFCQYFSTENKIFFFVPIEKFKGIHIKLN